MMNPPVLIVEDEELDGASAHDAGQNRAELVEELYPGQLRRSETEHGLGQPRRLEGTGYPGVRRLVRHGPIVRAHRWGI